MQLNVGYLLLVTSICGIACHGKALLPRPKEVTGSGFISLPVIAVNNPGGQLQKRQVNTDLFNTDIGTVYLVHLSLGTPAQPVYLLLDTGSSETWVDPNCTTASSTHQQDECSSFPRYDPSTSSTALDVGYPFELEYGKGTASGEYFRETFHIAGATITELQFGWADTTAAMFAGILATGYGYEIVGYYCLLDEMFLQGIINSRAFSLDLGDVDAAAGSILFGGIDTKKFTGSLEKRPIMAPIDAPDGYLRYWIYMTSVGITKPGATTSERYTVDPPAYQQPVFLDSGGTLCHLPASLVAAMLGDFTGVVDNGDGLYTIDCAQTTQGGTLDFGFGNTTIRVPYHEFIWVPSPGVCIFGAKAVDTLSWVLGDTFLRSCYTVFDQDNDNLLLAQYVDCGTNIVPIGSGVDAVPSVTGLCNPTSTVASSTSKTSTSPIKSTSTVKVSSSVQPTSLQSSSITSSATTSKPPSSSSLKPSSSSSTVKPTSSSSSSKSLSSIKLTTSSSTKLSSSPSPVISSSTSKTSSLSSVKTSSSTSSKVSSSPSSSSVKPSSSSSNISTFSTLKSSSCSENAISSSSVTSRISSTASTTKPSSSSKLQTSRSSIKSFSSASFGITTSSQNPPSKTTSPATATTRGYQYVGCFKKSKPRSMTKILANDTMSVDVCLSMAKAHVPPYPYAGLEYARECWAAYTSPAAATPTSGTAACTKTCVGNPTQTCGGAAMFNLYHSPAASP